MSSLKKLNITKSLIEKELFIFLKSLKFEPKFARISVILRDNVHLFIRYNNHDEYSYNILFSKVDLDRCRFDNFDARWDISSKPHHFHPRFSKEGIKSPMNGNPEHDIPKLIKLVISGILLLKNHEF